MHRGDFLEVAILADYRETVLYCGGGDQGVGQFDRALNPSGSAVGDEVGPSAHHGLADWNRIRRTGEGERVGTTGPYRIIGGIEDAQLKLADRNHRDRNAIGQVGKGSSGLARDEDRSVEQAPGRWRGQRSSRV